MKLSVAGAALLLALSTACGSTVQLRSTVGQGGDGLVPASGSVLGPSDASSDPAVRATAKGGSQTKASVGTPSSVAVPSDVGGAHVATRNSAPVKVGWVVLESNSAFAASIGASAFATPDQTPYAQGMVDWINTHGGLGGRQITPVYWHMDASGSQTNEQYGASACAAFTQDNHVEVVVDTVIGSGSSTLVRCLDTHHIPHVDVTGSLDMSSATVRTHPLYLPANGVADDTLASLEVAALAARGFYAKGSTLGVITYDTPGFHDAVEHVLKPQLKARTGLIVQDSNITYLPAFTAASDTAATSAAVSNAVLKYQTHGVDRVIFLQNFSIATVLFMTDAENQQYHPLYGLSSNDSPQADVSLAPAAQLRNAIGFGWRPSYDVTAAQQLQPGRPYCLNIFRSKKLTFTAGDASEAAALRHCEGALLLQAGMNVTRGALGAPLVRAVESHLGSYQAATVLGIRLSAQHHDGVSAYRDLSFGPDCSCFRYTSAPREIR